MSFLQWGDICIYIYFKSLCWLAPTGRSEGRLRVSSFIEFFLRLAENNKNSKAGNFEREFDANPLVCRLRAVMYHPEQAVGVSLCHCVQWASSHISVCRIATKGSMERTLRSCSPPEVFHMTHLPIHSITMCARNLLLKSLRF